MQVIYHLGDLCLKMANIKNSREKIDMAISNGTAYEILTKMIYEHGGKLNEIKHTPKYKMDIKANEDGYINYVNTREIGFCILNISNIKKEEI